MNRLWSSICRALILKEKSCFLSANSITLHLSSLAPGRHPRITRLGSWHTFAAACHRCSLDCTSSSCLAVPLQASRSLHDSSFSTTQGLGPLRPRDIQLESANNHQILRKRSPTAVRSAQSISLLGDRATLKSGQAVSKAYKGTIRIQGSRRRRINPPASPCRPAFALFKRIAFRLIPFDKTTSATSERSGIPAIVQLLGSHSTDRIFDHSSHAHCQACRT